MVIDGSFWHPLVMEDLISQICFFAASDVAGEVVKVGPGVTNFKAGDKVVAMLHHFVSSRSHS